jgi:hypothetical protein
MRKICQFHYRLLHEKAIAGKADEHFSFWCLHRFLKCQFRADPLKDCEHILGTRMATHGYICMYITTRTAGTPADGGRAETPAGAIVLMGIHAYATGGRRIWREPQRGGRGDVFKTYQQPEGSRLST